MHWYANSLRCLVLALCLLTLQSDDSKGQDANLFGKNDTDLGTANAVNRNLMLLRRVDVQRELDMTREQIKEIGSIRDRIDRELDSAVFNAKFPNGNLGVTQQKMASAIREAVLQSQRKTTEELTKVLLPHQMKRLSQLEFQSRMSSFSLKSYRSDELANALDLSAEQRRELDAKLPEIRKNLQAKVERAMAEANAEAQNLLTAEQRSRLVELVGEPFRFDDRPRTMK